MVGALLFFRSFVVFQKRHRFLEKSLVAKILKPNIIYVFVKFKGERHLFFWIAFCVEDFYKKIEIMGIIKFKIQLD